MLLETIIGQRSSLNEEEKLYNKILVHHLQCSDFPNFTCALCLGRFTF